MSFGGLEHGTTGRPRATPMSEINMTPLIDVMLVLLVIFILTAPLLTHAIRLDLPRAAGTPTPDTPSTITVAIDAAGKFYWNDQPLPISKADLDARLTDAGRASVAAGTACACRSGGALPLGGRGDGCGPTSRSGADRLCYRA